MYPYIDQDKQFATTRRPISATTVAQITYIISGTNHSTDRQEPKETIHAHAGTNFSVHARTKRCDCEGKRDRGSILGLDHVPKRTQWAAKHRHDNGVEVQPEDKARFVASCGTKRRVA